MAVYTKISKKDISYINRKFDIEKILKFKGIKQGIENTNYLLKSKNKKFILTIFEKRVSKKELPFFMNLMDKLNKSKINCPKPQTKKDGGYLINLKNKAACIVSFLNGKDKKSLNFKNCYNIGKMIAEMHQSTKKMNLTRKNSMGVRNLNPLLKSIRFKSKKFTNLEKFLKNNYKDIKSEAEEYLKVMGNPFDEIIFDPKGQIGMELGVYATPETFLISKEGLILYKHIGELSKNDWVENFLPFINPT